MAGNPQRLLKRPLDQAPAQREVAVILWHLPDHVQVVRKDHRRLYPEGMASPDVSDRVPQQVDHGRIAEHRPSPRSDDGEEIGLPSDLQPEIAHTMSVCPPKECFHGCIKRRNVGLRGSATNPTYREVI